MEAVNSTRVFEIFGVYFANCYWNSLYESSLNIWHDEHYEILDEAYRVSIKRYNLAFCKKANPDEKINSHYVRIVKDIYQTYKEFLKTSDTYHGFIDMVVKFLIPADYYESMSTHDDRKDAIFKDILSKTLTKFTLFIHQEGVSLVVDANVRRNAKVPLQTWKRKYIDLLTQERNSFCSLLLAKNSGVDIRNPEEIPSIPKEVMDKLSVRLKNLLAEKAQAIKERNQYAKLAQTYKELLQKQQPPAPPVQPPATITLVQSAPVKHEDIAPIIQEASYSSESASEEDPPDIADKKEIYMPESGELQPDI